MCNVAAGVGAYSIAGNGLGSFGMIFLTMVIGLDPVLAALTTSASILWDAITDPIMGHITDNTRSRWGRRHPYLILGGLLIALIFLGFWTLPQLLIGRVGALMVLLITLQLLFKTAQTIYYVPYIALGFEVFPQYELRSNLQGKIWFTNQALNFICVALAWPLFFKDKIVIENGAEKLINGSHIPENYSTMAWSITALILLLALYCARSTRRFATDNRDTPKGSNRPLAFLKDFGTTFKNKLFVFVVLFMMIAGFGMGFMAQTQMYTYVFFMKFAPWEKTFAHGGGMIATALAGLLLPKIVRRFDKKPAGFIGIGTAVFGGAGLWLVFGTGIMEPQFMPLFNAQGQPFHLSAIVFGLLQMCFWGGCGLLVPLSISLIADVAAISAKKTGTEPKNATYASLNSFSQKCSWTVTGLVIGACIKGSGFIPGEVDQTPEAIQGIAALCFLSGPLMMACAGVMLAFYPVTRRTLARYENNEPGDFIP